MEAVNFGSQNYNTKYQNQEKPAESSYNNINKTPKDSFNKKYKQKTNKEGVRFAATVALMAASAFAAYKGKDTIKQTLSVIKSKSGKTFSKLGAKFPNMTQSLSYLKKACQTPLNAIKGVGSKIKNIFTKTT